MNKIKPFIIFEMANNHQGSLEHGVRIIRELSEVSASYGFEYGVKFQYRDLDTFIHPDYRNRTDLKFVKRFKETRLSDDDYIKLINECKRVGFKTICTPFDEASVIKIKNHGFDYLKIASCSVKDWPLLDEVCKVKIPVIASTGGASMDDVDNIVSLFAHHSIELKLMHCVGLYPTPNDKLQLNRIDWFKERYPEIDIGFSTHENPGELFPVSIAIGKGATIFEKHVGVEDKENGIELNGYSCNPSQIREWLEVIDKSISICGMLDADGYIASEQELLGLRDLKRGVYCINEINSDSKFTDNDVFFAMPIVEGQMSSESFSKHNLKLVSLENYHKNDPVMQYYIDKKDIAHILISNIIHKVKGQLNQAKIHINPESSIELSHHYGIERIGEFGAVLFDCINQEYCKKIIAMVPGQYHPEHFHKRKKESFQVLWGDLVLTHNATTDTYGPGDIVTIERMEKHSFATNGGVIFEEVSTTHYNNDSFYSDNNIALNNDRKTNLVDWWMKY